MGPARAGRGLLKAGGRALAPARGARSAPRAALMYNYSRIRQYYVLFVPKPSGVLKELPRAAPINVRFWE